MTTPDRLMRPGLASPMGIGVDAFMRLIDATGGWPLGYDFVGFEHTCERAAGFAKTSRNTGWWTTLFDADDYHFWKLSPAARQRIVDSVIAATSIREPDAARVRFTTRRGDRMPAATPIEGTPT